MQIGLDEIGLWDHALSAAELTALYEGGFPSLVEGGKWRAGRSFADGFRAGQRVGKAV